MIIKKKSVNISAYRVCREFRIFEFIKYSKERWSVRILIIIKVFDSSARHYLRARIMANISLLWIG
jgi:glutamate formiminotransferase